MTILWHQAVQRLLRQHLEMRIKNLPTENLFSLQQLGLSEDCSWPEELPLLPWAEVAEVAAILTIFRQMMSLLQRMIAWGLWSVRRLRLIRLAIPIHL